MVNDAKKVSMFKMLAEQCETVEDCIDAHEAMNGLLSKERQPALPPTPPVGNGQVAVSATPSPTPKARRKYSSPVNTAQLGSYPKDALVKYGRLLPQQVKCFMDEEGVSHLFPRGKEIPSIIRFYSRNLGRTYRRYGDGSYGLVNHPGTPIQTPPASWLITDPA